MKVEVAQSFFNSLKQIDSISSKYYEIRAWFKFHFSKDFRKILKTALHGYPWQESFLYELEKVKIQEMINYHKKVKRFVGWEYVVRDMELCVKLIDMMLDDTPYFHFNGNLVFKKTEDCETYSVGKTEDFKYVCDVKVNTRNIDRFCAEKEKDSFLKFPHELYLRKIKHLYHKIRYERDCEWWD